MITELYAVISLLLRPAPHTHCLECAIRWVLVLILSSHCQCQKNGSCKDNCDYQFSLKTQSTCVSAADVLSGSGHGSEHHTGLLEEWAGGHSRWWNTRIAVVLATLITMLGPLCCLRHIGAKSYLDKP
jgi:hypothetical protein